MHYAQNSVFDCSRALNKDYEVIFTCHCMSMSCFSQSIK